MLWLEIVVMSVQMTRLPLISGSMTGVKGLVSSLFMKVVMATTIDLTPKKNVQQSAQLPVSLLFNAIIFQRNFCI